ncbi:MAG: galactose-binding domain-containing protein [Ginsengibacter sp.]
MKSLRFFLLAFIVLSATIQTSFLFAQTENKGIVNIIFLPNHPANKFIPSQNIGGAIDGHFKGDINKMLTRSNIAEMKQAGLKPVSYRLRTELAGETWHWNPKGKWSDSVNQQGYWISDTTSNQPIRLSYGYRLPRRGNTHDQANDDGYSKITDGDTSSFWKSNPFLDSSYTHESNDLHPQWVIVDLGKNYRINAVKINWGNPYALNYKVEFAKGYDPQYFDPFEPGIWHSFSNYQIDNSKQRKDAKKISANPVSIRFIRISFSQSSYTSCPVNSVDARDKLGFAIKEIEVGFLDDKSNFHDYVHHAAGHKQSVVYVSSTDPWHTAKDKDENTEQPGIDRFFSDGVTSGLPAMIPAALLYDTPENVLSLFKYIRSKNYPVNEIEMGEEPEGQLVAPTDYSALYLQLAKRLKAFDKNLKLGGPCFASLSSDEEDSTTFTEAKWTKLFLEYLNGYKAIDLFNFFSFEWYPFDDLCASSAPQLAAAPGMLSTAMKNIKNVLPANIPMYVTEYGYSAYEGKPEVEMQGALMYADILGKFLELGGKKSFLYGYEPAFLQQSSNCGYGNNMLLGLSDSGKINYKTAAFYGTQMVTKYWAQPSDSLLEVFPANCNIKNRKDQTLVSTYALCSPTGKWSILLINKDPKKEISVDVKIEDALDKKIISFVPHRLIQYSGNQYEWKANGRNGHPEKSAPPEFRKIDSASNISLPPFSITVIN